MQKKCKGRASSRRKKYGSITVIQTKYFTILVELDFFLILANIMANHPD